MKQIRTTIFLIKARLRKLNLVKTVRSENYTVHRQKKKPK